MTGTQQRAVVVGCQVGRMHADAYSHSDATELVALCDLDEQALHNVADAHDVDARYTDFETMLREQQPDLISIATPQAAHAAMTILAATEYTPRGILCEKGMANNLGEARAMLAACDRNDVKLIIGHENRYLTQIQQARQLIADGAIGDVRLSHVWYAQGGMMNQMCHGCDRNLFLLGDPQPTWVMGNVQRHSDRWERGWPAEEAATGIVGFADGSRLVLEGETPKGPHAENHRHTLIGTEGMLVVRTESEVAGRSGTDPYQHPDDSIGLRVHRANGQVEEFPFVGDTLGEARRREVDAFARWVAGEIPGHHQDAHLCIQTQEIMMAIYESARTHSLVELPLKTQASPLIAMINEGTLPIRSPGWHDIRHRTATAPNHHTGGSSK